MTPSLPPRFEPRNQLGAGSFGEVWRARDTALDRDVAIKLLRIDVADPEVEHRFQREARVTAQLRHPHVVQVFDHGVHEGRAWIAYEFLEGVTLQPRHPGATPEDAWRWGGQLAGALRAAHDAGVLHRDVKPSNVLIRPDGDAVLVDFGIARTTREGTLATPEGLVLGTPAYMAPETLLGQPPSPASDGFGLAATLVAALTGTLPYGSDDLATILDAARRAHVERPEIPGDGALAAVLDRSLDPSPDRRPVDLPEAFRARAAPDESVTVVLEPKPSVAPEPPRRGRLPAALALVAALGLGARLLAPGAPAPTLHPTPKPPTDDALSELAATMTKHREALLEGHLREGQIVPRGGGHAVASAASLLEIGPLGKLRRAGEAGIAWMAAASERGVLDQRANVEEAAATISAIRHVSGDYQELDHFLAPSVKDWRLQETAFTEADRGKIRASLATLNRSSRDLQEDLESRGLWATVSGASLAVVLARVARPKDAGDLHRLLDEITNRLRENREHLALALLATEAQYLFMDLATGDAPWSRYRSFFDVLVSGEGLGIGPNERMRSLWGGVRMSLEAARRAPDSEWWIAAGLRLLEHPVFEHRPTHTIYLHLSRADTLDDEALRKQLEKRPGGPALLAEVDALLARYKDDYTGP